MALPPGPQAPVFLQTWRWWRHPTAFLEDCAARYGGMFTIRVWGNRDKVILSDPAAIRAVFAGSPDRMYVWRDPSFAALTGPSSLLISNGPQHSRHRRLLVPIFQLDAARCQGYGQAICDLTEQMLDAWPLHLPFPLIQQMQDLSLRVILRLILGLAPGAQLEALLQLSASGLQELENPLMLVPVSMQGALRAQSPWARVVKLREAGDAILYEEIARARRADLRHRRDVLALLAAARDDSAKPLDDAELRDAVVSLLLAGHHTTASALTWAICFLLREPALWERARGEVLAARRAGAVAAILDLPLLDAIVHETLRLMPVFPFSTRRLKQPMHLLGYDLPAGTQVAPCSYLVQRRPSLYPQPHRFLPERFLRARRLPPSAWCPFGGGFRRCIGSEFALLQMKMILATLLARATLTLQHPQPPHPVWRLTALTPADGVPVLLTARAG